MRDFLTYIIGVLAVIALFGFIVLVDHIPECFNWTFF